MDIKNSALLSKWIFKLLTIDWTWQQLIQNKYLGSKTLSQAYCKSWDLHFFCQSYESETRFSMFWILHNQRWVASEILGGQVVRKHTFE